MIITYYKQKKKKNRNLKYVDFKTLKTQKYVSNFQKCFTIYMWGRIMYMTYLKKVVVYNT